MISSLSANFEAWVGTGFINHTSHLDKSEINEFVTMSGDINKVIYIGPTIDITAIPYNTIPVGITLSSQMLFPTGYNTATFRSYNYDFKNRNMIGISYNKSFTDKFGIFLKMGYEFDFYRNSTTNNKNSKEPIEYNKFYNHSLYGELGLLTTINNGYFKFGINYSHSLINKAYSYDFIFAGGFRF